MVSDTNDAAVSSKAPIETIWDCLKPAVSPLSCGKVFYFDPRGDMTLHVDQLETGGICQFVVCSRTLDRSSPVFRVMLFNGFAESKPEGESAWTVKLPEDGIYPVYLFLNIIHGHTMAVPDTLKPEELYQLLVLTEKYNMTHVLRPLASMWFQPYREAANVAGNGIFLCIAWALGHEETFRYLSLDLVLKSKIDDDGQLLDSNGIPLSAHKHLEPPDILGNISSRTGVITTD
ncbi:nuclear pore protein [Colletotrichum incanum]|nr:nuclear pore protein [Colletotrichum incanum]